LVTAIKRDDFDIITVVLGSDTKKIRTQDSIKLIEYVYANFELVDIGEIAREDFETWRRTNQNRIDVTKGRSNNMSLDLGQQIYRLISCRQK